MDARTMAETISREASDALDGTGIVVDGAHVQQAGRRRLVRVFLARDVSGLAPDDHTSAVEPLSLDEVADATQTVSEALDGSEAVGESSYTLEVSSAGLDRPLSSPEQFRRNVGRKVKITLADGSTLSDRLTTVSTDQLTLADRPDSPVALGEVRNALVQVEFTRHDGKDD